MFKKLNQLILVFSSQGLYWLSYILVGVALLAVALFYQYYLDELPCVLCIHIRLWISLLIMVSLVGLALRKYYWPKLMSHALVVMVALGLAESSYQLLGTERGFVFGDCGFNAGLPAWFALEDWLPWIYRVETSCGYTPELLFGITMAEALMLMSVVLLCLSVWVLLTSVFQKTH